MIVKMLIIITYQDSSPKVLSDSIFTKFLSGTGALNVLFLSRHTTLSFTAPEPVCNEKLESAFAILSYLS